MKIQASGAFLMMALTLFNMVNPSPEPKVSPIVSAIEKAKSYDVAFQVTELNTGKSWGHRENEQFVAASTWKMPVVISLYSMAAKGTVSLNEKIAIQSRHKTGGTGYLQYEPVGTTHSLGYLSRVAITHSDNVAWWMLNERTWDEMQIVLAEQNIEFETDESGSPVTTPKDMAKLLTSLAKKAEGNGIYREVIHWMSQSIYRDWIPSGVPNGVMAANKVGMMDDLKHDIAIVYAKNPYVLCLYSQGNVPDVVLAEISWEIYNGMNNE